MCFSFLMWYFSLWIMVSIIIILVFFFGGRWFFDMKDFYIDLIGFMFLFKGKIELKKLIYVKYLYSIYCVMKRFIF